MADGAESCGGLRDFVGVGGGGFLLTVDGEGVGETRGERRFTRLGFLAGRIDYTLTG